MIENSEHADSGWDDYAVRVLRNEGRLQGLEILVAETRESDRKLIEQRSESLARELERRAESVHALSKEERDADRRELALLTSEAEKRGALALSLLREVQDTAIRRNYEQSREAISALEQRRIAAADKLEQMVRQWRDSDREARELFAAENSRHLDVLNHNNERMSAFQANSVTRELWQAEKDASVNRENLLRDQIISLEKTLLAMMPIAQADKMHAEIVKGMETSIAASTEVLDNKIGVVTEKLSDLRSYQDTTTGRSSGYVALYGWAVAAVGLLVTVILAANAMNW